MRGNQPEPTVAICATEALDAAQRAAIVDACIAAHDTEAFRELFTTFIPSGGRHALVYLDAELVSHGVVTTRWLQPADGRVLRTAFVDAVSTLPQYQGRGYGSTMMRALAAAVDDFEIGCLQTDKPGFYERLGWQLWRGPLGGRDADDRVVPTPDQQGVMVLQLARTPALDLDALLTVEVQPARIWE